LCEYELLIKKKTSKQKFKKILEKPEKTTIFDDFLNRQAPGATTSTLNFKKSQKTKNRSTLICMEHTTKTTEAKLWLSGSPDHYYHHQRDRSYHKNRVASHEERGKYR
jgi:hypothetical protein